MKCARSVALARTGVYASSPVTWPSRMPRYFTFRLMLMPKELRTATYWSGHVPLVRNAHLERLSCNPTNKPNCRSCSNMGGGGTRWAGGEGDVQQEVVCIKEHVYLWGYSLQCMHNDGAYHRKYCWREGVSLLNTGLGGRQRLL